MNMNLLDYLIPFVGALGLLILIHELGHYLVARWCGVKVLRFSIGFGKPLLVRRAGVDQTEWALAAFPLGGYVKMLDEREAPVAAEELHRAFNRQSVYRRIAIVAAGPLANLLLAVVLYWGLFVGGTDELRARISVNNPASLAAQAGLADGDLVRSLNGEQVRSWEDLRWLLLQQVIDKGRAELEVETVDERRLVRSLDLSAVAIEDEGRDLIARIGLQPWRPLIPAVIGRLEADGAAARAGLQVGDEIIAIAGQAIHHWGELVEQVREAPGERLRFDLRRQGGELSVELTADAVGEGESRVGRIGVAVAPPPDAGASMFTTVRYGLGEGLSKAVRQTWDTSVLSLRMLGRMFTGEVSWKNLSGPVTIADYAGQTAQLGMSHYLKFVALISISLGVLNLLPIPVLDGGHLMYYTVEIIKGGPVPERIMLIGQQIGLALLAMLMAFAFYNDINRLISG